MHVALGAQGVAVGGGDAVGVFKRIVGLRRFTHTRCGARGHAFAARAPGQRDQCHIAFAHGNGLSRVAHQAQVGSTTQVGGIQIAGLDVQVLHHGRGAHAGCVACAEIAVDVVAGQACVGKSALGHLSVQLRYRFVFGQARGVLKGPHDIGF